MIPGRYTRREVADMSGLAGATRRLRRWWIVPTLGMLVTGGGVAASSAIGQGNGHVVRAAAVDDTMTRDAIRMDQGFVQLWNENRLAELVQFYYADDAIVIPPNTEPLRGHAAILAYYKNLRDILGPLEGGTDFFRTSSSGNLVSLVPKYSVRFGRLRITSHELFERQPDGSLKDVVDMFGSRDPMP
jgi:ketosteroid isomerase-like protein